MPHLLYEKTKSNHKNIIGLFENKSQAEIYVKMLKNKEPIKQYVIEEIEFLDESPELTKFVLMPAQI